MLYVPHPIGNGEQRFNAEPVVAAGGGIMVVDADLTAGRLAAEVILLITDDRRLADMGARAAAYGIRDGAARLADMVTRLRRKADDELDAAAVVPGSSCRHGGAG